MRQSCPVSEPLFFFSYREASVEVIEVMSRFAVIERASIDEAYMDLTAAVQQRLKNMSESHIDSQMLSTTYIQGFPQKSPGDEATAESDAPSKGNLWQKLQTNCFYHVGALESVYCDAVLQRK